MWKAIFQAIAAGFEFCSALVRRKNTTDASTDAEIDAAAARAGAAAGAAASAASKQAGKDRTK